MKDGRKNAGEYILGFLFFMIFSISSWLCSVPMWLTLILHFTVGLSIWWFIGTLIAWIVAGLIRYLLICFGRWGAAAEDPVKENKNPYSTKE